MEPANHNSVDIKNVYYCCNNRLFMPVNYFTGFIYQHIFVSGFRILLHTELKNALDSRKGLKIFVVSVIRLQIFFSASVRRFVCSISNNICGVKATLIPFRDVRKLLWKYPTAHIYTISGSVWKQLQEQRSHSLLQLPSTTPM
jgi:hypothetical protein